MFIALQRFLLYIQRKYNTTTTSFPTIVMIQKSTGRMLVFFTNTQ